MRLLAEERNVRAQAFFEEGTPQSALEFTARRLGPENVFIFNETGYYPFSPGVP